MTNILVIKLRYIGDVLLATPVLRALRERFPDARITMAVNPGTEDMLRWNPDINDVLVVSRGGLAAQIRFLREIRRRRFDCVIDLTDSDRSAILAGFSGAPDRVGFNEEHRWRGLLYSSTVKVKADVVHRVDQDLEALRLFGIEPKAVPLALFTSAQDQEEATRLLEDIGAREPSSGPSRPLVMLQPGARYWFKAWPAERFAELADRLAEAFHCTVLIGGDAGDQKLAQAIRAQARSGPVNLAGRTALLQYAAVLKRCVLFVGNDNGPMQMAGALGVPIVALFGPSDPAVWGPRNGKAEVLYKGLDCRRCFHPTCERGPDNCMRQISVDEAFAAACRLLARKEIVSGRT